MTVGQARATYLTGRTGAFPVIDGGRVIGFVSAETVDGMWDDRPIREVVTPSAAVVTVAPTDPVSSVIQQLQDGRVAVALVMDGGRLVGVIGPEDVSALLGSPATARR